MNNSASFFQDSFFDVSRETKLTSQGQVDFPILYFDTSCVLAFFLCDLDKVKAQLVDVPLEPGIVVANKAIVGVALYEYRQTSIGAYNEVGVGIPVVHKGSSRAVLPLLDLFAPIEKRKTGFYVVDLPVTTQAANAAGREMWGLPKFVTDIPFQLNGRQFSCSVLDPDTRQDIMTIDGKMGLGIPSPAMHLKLYSFLQGDTLETAVNLRRGATLRAPGSIKIKLGDSHHPMAERLRALGLDGKSPIALTATNEFQSRLNLGEVRGAR